MAFAVQRTYGAFGRDYLHDWCSRWGTSCMLSRNHAMVFDTEDEAMMAAEKAQRVCTAADGKQAKGISFSPVAL